MGAATFRRAGSSRSQAPQLYLRSADLAPLLGAGSDVTRWPNRGTLGPPQDAVPVVVVKPKYYPSSDGGFVRFVGDDFLQLATLFPLTGPNTTYYNLEPRLLSVVFASPTYRTVAGYGAQGFIDFASVAPPDAYAPGFAYIPGRVIKAPTPPAPTARTVISTWVYPDASFPSGMAIRVFINEQVSDAFEFAAQTQQAPFFIGRGNSGQIPETGQVDVFALRGHFRLVSYAEALALHNELCRNYR